ncbi:MFS transporter [Oscillospiraceae bacterium WX1]
MEGQTRRKYFVGILIVYLAGIFMGAIDTGIVTPAREIIQNNFLVDGKTGIWMITVYTLAYAASIPVTGKLADRVGRKTIYIISIFLFGFGSLFCGLSHNFGGFWFLVGARALQAVGGGGIVPIATAEFGTSFPVEKRGMALGLVGAVYGIANIFGSLAGSAILDLFGNQNWQYIFFINVPITVFIIIVGVIVLPNNKDISGKKIDFLGILFVVAMVLALLYGLQNIDFFNFKESFLSTAVYPYLIAFVVLLPVFIIAEKKAQDPIINLDYFTNKRIAMTLLVAFVAGFILMGIVFIPQFSENALKMKSGTGGYFTMILGLLAGVSAAFSGRLIDKIGAKSVLLIGFAISIVGALFLMLVAANNPGIVNVVTSLMLLGFGLGFTMGAPVNYMMLENISDKDASAGLATLSLLRSVGTTIAPAIMVGFIAHAGLSLQSNLTAALPDEIKVPNLPYVQEIMAETDKLKNDPNMAEKLNGVDIPDLTAMQTVKINFESNDESVSIPDDVLKAFQTSDVTTITDAVKLFAEAMFDETSPQRVDEIQKGIKSGIDGITAGRNELSNSISKLHAGYSGLSQGVDGMQQGLVQQQAAIEQLQQFVPMMTGALPGGMTLLDIIPAAVREGIPKSVQATLATVKTPEDLQAQISALEEAETALNAKILSSKKALVDMKTALTEMAAAEDEMTTLVSQMTVLRDEIPAAFKTAESDYLAEIDSRSARLENVYQRTLNGGYKMTYLVVAVSAAVAMLLLVFYQKKKDETA